MQYSTSKERILMRRNTKEDTEKLISQIKFRRLTLIWTQKIYTEASNYLMYESFFGYMKPIFILKTVNIFSFGYLIITNPIKLLT